MAGIDNLKPFKKGQSGNPKGYPKGVPNTATRLKRFLELSQKITNPISGKTEDITVAEQLDLAIIAKARKGDVRAFNALMDRLEGKPQQSVDVTTQGESIKGEYDPETAAKFAEFLKSDTKQ